MKFLKKIQIVFICFLSAIVVQSQTSSRSKYAKFAEHERLDKASIECLYEYTAVDTVLDQTKTFTDILQVGNKLSKYFGYPQYQTDSVVYRMDIHKITTNEAGKIFGKYGYGNASKCTVIKDNVTGAMNVYDKVFIDYFVYPDTASFDWQLRPETVEVCGYRCQKAETDFRGRHWTAYFTEEIPVSGGPMKFSGLPGLILKVEDSAHQHCFTAIMIRKANSDIYMDKKRDLFKTSRQRFNKQLTDYMLDSGAAMTASGMVKDANTGEVKTMPKRRRFFNPIELQ